MEKIILAISGRPGLYQLLTQGRNNLIVEDIISKKRSPVGGRESVTSIADISMYSEDDDVSLMTVLSNIKKEYNAEKIAISPKKASEAELREVMAKGLPNYDKDRVHLSDIKKLIQWYNLLVDASITDFEEATEEKTTEE